MSSQTVKPDGVATAANWHRYGSPAADKLLAAFETESDVGKQHALVTQLGEVFANEAPAIPLYANPSWGAYNTRHFTDFPSAAKPYGDPSPNKSEEGDCLRALTTIRPVVRP
jgi:peptide/nickel transport system substrate-binding protein